MFSSDTEACIDYRAAPRVEEASNVREAATQSSAAVQSLAALVKSTLKMAWEMWYQSRIAYHACHAIEACDVNL